MQDGSRNPYVREKTRTEKRWRKKKTQDLLAYLGYDRTDPSTRFTVMQNAKNAIRGCGEDMDDWGRLGHADGVILRSNIQIMSMSAQQIQDWEAFNQ